MNRNKSEVVYTHIRDMILKQDIRSGERIPEESIAELLNVSRTPIREALRRLNQEGIVNIYPGRSADVATFDKKSIQDLGMTRLFLDELSVQLVIQNGSNSDFEELDNYIDICDEFVEKNDRFNAVRIDSEFHLKIAKISENKVLYKILDDIHLQVRLIQINKLENNEDLLENTHLHRAIVDAIKERNSELAVSLVREHLIPFYELQDNTVVKKLFS